MSVFINKLLKDTSKYHCLLKIGDSVIPYTRLKNYNVQNSDDEEYINLYNLITDKSDKILKSEIISYDIKELKIVENIKRGSAFIKQCKFYYDKAKEKNISSDSFFKILMNETIIKHELQETLFDFDFAIDHNDIINNVLSEEKRNIIIEAYIKMIDRAANDSKEELYELRKSCETDEDKEDIDAIVEMFDECKEEIELEDVKTLTDLIDCWPPLLMPAPESILKIQEVDILRDNGMTKLEEFKEIINSIKDKSVIQDFIKMIDEEKGNIHESQYNEYKAILDENL